MWPALVGITQQNFAQISLQYFTARYFPKPFSFPEVNNTSSKLINSAVHKI
jgi:hypothetical protein